MERKFLRIIAAVAAVLTIAMLVYTMSAAMQGRSRATASLTASGAATVSSTAAAPDLDEKLFPAQIAGMTRASALMGSAALDSVRQLHGKDIPVQKAYVVEYSKGPQQMTIWFSETADVQAATQLFQIMDEKMPKTSAFKDYKTLTIGSKTFKFVTGMGSDHYYWQSGKRVLWAAISGLADSQQVLKEIANLY